MLGNDIVDLLDPESRPETFRPGFDERVFSVAERRAIVDDVNPLARRWAHWAAKEAAYKLARQIDPHFVFSPGKLVACYAPVANLNGRRLERRGRLNLNRPVGPSPASRVTTGSLNKITTVELRSFETSERIHVVAIALNEDWGEVEFAVERQGREDSSMAVRKLALGEISRSLGISRSRLSIGTRGRIPTIELDGSRTPLSLSLSHHGNWIGYAMRLCVNPLRPKLWTERLPLEKQPDQPGDRGLLNRGPVISP